MNEALIVSGGFGAILDKLRRFRQFDSKVVQSQCHLTAFNSMLELQGSAFRANPRKLCPGHALKTKLLQLLAASPSFLLRLHSIFPRREVHLSLLLLLRDSASILLAQSSPNGASLLGPEVERKVLLVVIELSQSVSLVGVDHGQAAGNRFAEVVAREQDHVSRWRKTEVEFIVHTFW